jgi:hypothetical protein
MAFVAVVPIVAHKKQGTKPFSKSKRIVKSKESGDKEYKFDPSVFMTLKCCG